MSAVTLRARAVLLVRPGIATAEKQTAAALAYIQRHPGYTLTALTADPDAVLALVASGAADVVLVVDDDAELAEQVTDRGGRVEQYRKTPRRVRLDLVPVVAGMYRRGADVDTIAHLLDLDRAEVRRLLTARRTPRRTPPHHQRPGRTT